MEFLFHGHKDFLTGKNGVIWWYNFLAKSVSFIKKH